jgi:hypothetical protein
MGSFWDGVETLLITLFIFGESPAGGNYSDISIFKYHRLLWNNLCSSGNPPKNQEQVRLRDCVTQANIVEGERRGKRQTKLKGGICQKGKSKNFV